MEKHLTIKLVSSEEIICQFVKEDDYEITIMFPMLVKHIPRTVEGHLVETISLAPYTYFAADDEFTFGKHQILFIKELNPIQLDNYNQAIDDFINSPEVSQPDLQTADDLKKITDKLAKIFGKTEDEYLDEEVFFINDQSKSIH
jgi:hypothetical protein